jgi:hypothetical protein
MLTDIRALADPFLCALTNINTLSNLALVALLLSIASELSDFVFLLTRIV